MDFGIARSTGAPTAGQVPGADTIARSLRIPRDEPRSHGRAAPWSARSNTWRPSRRKGSRSISAPTSTRSG